MSFLTEFVRPFQEEINKKVSVSTARALRIVAEEAYNEIFFQWPADTLWSMANHKMNIGINPSETFSVSPPERPTQKGALINEQEANRQENLAKLKDIKPFDKVLIGNGVPYAADVGWQTGNGLRIYQEITATISARASSIIKAKESVGARLF